jgi:adenylyltransferase/sulfurtransferase
MTSPLKLLSPEYRIRTQDFAQLCKQGKVSLIDVRDETQFGICALPDSTNIPWNGRPDAWLTKAKDSGLLNNESPECFIICRYGNDSQLAVRRVLEESDLHVKIRDVAGGFKSWREEVDESWPAY